MESGSRDWETFPLEKAVSVVCAIHWKGICLLKYLVGKKSSYKYPHPLCWVMGHWRPGRYRSLKDKALSWIIFIWWNSNQTKKEGSIQKRGVRDTRELTATLVYCVFFPFHPCCPWQRGKDGRKWEYRWQPVNTVISCSTFICLVKSQKCCFPPSSPTGTAA